MKKHNYNLLWILVLMYLIFVTLYLFFKKNRIKVNIPEIIQALLCLKIKKQVLVKYYGVDKTTFRKWIKYFCSDIFPDFENYLHKRSITVGEFMMIISILGLKTTHPVCSKKYIVETSEGSYRSLKESIAQYPERFGISEEAYVYLRIFPPIVSKRILKHYQ